MAIKQHEPLTWRILFMAMRDDIKIAIEKGGATKESLLLLTGTTEKGLASQFTYMRMMGNCPMKQEDGTFKIVTGEEWDAHKAESGTAVTKNLTPAQRVERAEKRSTRAASAFDNAKKRHEADKANKLNELKFIKADAEFKIAELELGAAEKILAEAPVGEAPVGEAPVDEAPVDEAPVDEAPVDEVPIYEVPYEITKGKKNKKGKNK